MIIYPLPAEELDDNTLDKQIIAIAQVLCNVHEVFEEREYEYAHVECTDWGLTCRANYLKLVDMGMACCEEFRYRSRKICENCKGDGGWFTNGDDYIDCKMCVEQPENDIWAGYTEEQHKLQSVINWCDANRPDLPDPGVYENIPKDNSAFIHSDKYLLFKTTPFPLCVPQKYIEYLSSTVRMGQAKPVDIAQSYCNYYRAVLRKDAKWTRREKPYFLAEDWEIVE